MTTTITVRTCRKCYRWLPDDNLPCECEGGPDRHELAMEAMREAGRRMRDQHDKRVWDAVEKALSAPRSVMEGGQ